MLAQDVEGGGDLVGQGNDSIRLLHLDHSSADKLEWGQQYHWEKWRKAEGEQEVKEKTHRR